MTDQFDSTPADDDLVNSGAGTASAEPGGCCSYDLYDASGNPVSAGDLLPDTISFGEPLDDPFAASGQLTAPNELSSAWLAADRFGNPVDPAAVLPSQLVVGGPQAEYTVQGPDGVPIQPGDVLPSTIVIGGPQGPMTDVTTIG
ncbi:MAG: hypothetical protein H0U29_03190, partial [Acidimicrobiia bacterium]|nr:hypothetical protein [Acidimicrobiia bacterium]